MFVLSVSADYQIFAAITLTASNWPMTEVRFSIYFGVLTKSHVRLYCINDKKPS